MLQIAGGGLHKVAVIIFLQIRGCFRSGLINQIADWPGAELKLAAPQLNGIVNLAGFRLIGDSLAVQKCSIAATQVLD